MIDTTVAFRMLGLAVFQVGVIELMAGLFTYFVILASFGFKPDLVIGIRNDWTNPAKNSVQDSYGQEWASSIFFFIFKKVEPKYRESMDIIQAKSRII